MKGRIFLCDFARAIDNGSRFDAIGVGINTVHSHQFPCPVTLAILVENTILSGEADREHSFEIKITDSEGKPVTSPIVGSVKLIQKQKGILYAAFNIQMLLKNPDTFTFSLLMNGEEKDSVKVQIIQVVQGSIPAAKEKQLA